MTVIQLQMIYRDFVEMRSEVSLEKAITDVRSRLEEGLCFVVPRTAAAMLADKGSFGGLVQRLRKDVGLTQIELGERIGRSASWVGQVERGARRVDRVSVLQDLARGLNLDDEASLLPNPEVAGGPNKVEIIPARSVYRAWVSDQ